LVALQSQGVRSPVIVIGEKGQESSLIQAFRLGCVDYLLYPAREAEVVSVVEGALKQARENHARMQVEAQLTAANQQKQAELVELEKFQRIVEHIDLGMMILDDRSEVILVNPTACEILGLGQDRNWKGRSISEVLPHHDIKSMMNHMQNRQDAQHEMTLSDGTNLSLQLSRIPGLGTALIIQDISYLKQIDRLRNDFVNTVSHDLRSPLTAIMGYVDLLERVGPLNEQQREFINRIETNVQSISTHLTDLLDLGRVEAGMESRLDSIHLDGILGYELEAFNHQISDKKIELHLDLPGNLPPVRGNLLRLRQMLGNLIGNAVKYTQAGGTIGIAAQSGNNEVLIRISDNGPGIPLADQPHVFDKFYRASNVPAGVSGSGLGLAIVKSIVENHGGRVWLESLPGTGSVFSVALPMYQPCDGQAEPAGSISKKQ
jgi:two-component system phosphate regulon sensor histidine kinase PhoR